MIHSASDPRQLIGDAIAHLDHVLPGQAPIHDFVHHNTLHGFQHLPFEQALEEFSQLTGIACYLPAQQFREFYRQGRINDDDLDGVLRQQFAETLTEAVGGGINRHQLYRAAMLQDLSATTPAQLAWYFAEQQVAPQTAALWQALLNKLDLTVPELHPEDLLDLAAEQVEHWQSTAGNASQGLREHSLMRLEQSFGELGEGFSLRGLLLALTGKDILDQVRPQLIRLCASLLDEGLAAWRLPGRERLGLYQAWRAGLQYDAQGYLLDLADWRQITETLPDDAVDAIVQQLQALQLPQSSWAGYLQRLALEISGWSGLINWRQTHSGYRTDDDTQPQLADYLALRLVLDRLHLQPLCRTLWRCELRVDKLKAYFIKHPNEFFVRRSLFQGQLPEYLVQAGHALLADDTLDSQAWQTLAERIWTWQHSPLAGEVAVGESLSVYRQGWRLFGLCRGLGLESQALQALSKQLLLNWLAVVDGFDGALQDYLWLCAYENHYRRDLLQALHANHGRGRWARREARPEAQIVFCMDDREESIRRHLEELNPAIETLGAAGFFGVAMNYRGLDDQTLTPLCPVVVVPAHNVQEHSDCGPQLQRHQQGRRWNRRFADWLHHGLRRHALWSYAATNTLAPFTLVGLLAKSFFPAAQQKFINTAAGLIAPAVATQLQFGADNTSGPATPQQPRLGFTDQEQADRVAGFLRNTGLTYGFAELVVLMGHGSISQNNPHLAAYDCGACSGRHGGPNARLFAAMANRSEVRSLLAERGIVIPYDCWFIGAEHNTGNEDITWYDLDAVPASRRAALDSFKEQMRHAQRMSAHERCRRLASAPRRPKPEQALRHFLNRCADFSQARPELGHATNAAAFVGRRSATQGAFFDRRLFLISYDATQDPEGAVLEGILLAVGPVGAGINLEYYFSTVNNERLGCGSKVPHNLTGFFAVMEGAGSDLRTGLPRQMIEIHEAMRLQMVVEAKTSVLEQIYGRQESLRELIGGGWVHLISQDPDSGDIFVFERGSGFVPWQAGEQAPPLRDNSPDCYRDESLPVAPMLIRQPGG